MINTLKTKKNVIEEIHLQLINKGFINGTEQIIDIDDFDALLDIFKKNHTNDIIATELNKYFEELGYIMENKISLYNIFYNEGELPNEVINEDKFLIFDTLREIFSIYKLI